MNHKITFEVLPPYVGRNVFPIGYTLDGGMSFRIVMDVNGQGGTEETNEARTQATAKQLNKLPAAVRTRIVS